MIGRGCVHLCAEHMHARLSLPCLRPLADPELRPRCPNAGSVTSSVRDQVIFTFSQGSMPSAHSWMSMAGCIHIVCLTYICTTQYQRANECAVANADAGNARSARLLALFSSPHHCLSRSLSSILLSFRTSLFPLSFSTAPAPSHPLLCSS